MGLGAMLSCATPCDDLLHCTPHGGPGRRHCVYQILCLASDIMSNTEEVHIGHFSGHIGHVTY